MARVLDLRANRHSIGWVQRGVYNFRVPANLRGGAASGLAAWLIKQLPSRPGARPVVMRIHSLRIEEDMRYEGSYGTGYGGARR